MSDHIETLEQIVRDFEPDAAPVKDRVIVAAIRAVLDGNARLTAERDEARAWVDRMQSEARVLTCVYCGHEYPPGTPSSGVPALTEHIRICPKHPLREAEARIANLQGARDELHAEAVELLTAAYISGGREGWEPGPSTNETMERILDWLCNNDADPSKRVAGERE